MVLVFELVELREDPLKTQGVAMFANVYDHTE